MRIDRQSFPFPLSDALVQILEEAIAKVQHPPEYGAILHFRDPGYAPETGGFHPVEISLDHRGRIRYITDFAYVGPPSFAELVKELDFDISLGLFQHCGREHPLGAGRGLFALWQENFVSYCRCGVYRVTIEKG